MCFVPVLHNIWNLTFRLWQSLNSVEKSWNYIVGFIHCTLFLAMTKHNSLTKVLLILWNKHPYHFSFFSDKIDKLWNIMTTPWIPKISAKEDIPKLQKHVELFTHPCTYVPSIQKSLCFLNSFTVFPLFTLKTFFKVSLMPYSIFH